MPIFEYNCTACGEEFEALLMSRSMAEDVACPQCGSKKIEKRFSVFSASKLSASSSTPRCETSGDCHTPNLPGCASGACGLS